MKKISKKMMGFKLIYRVLMLIIWRSMLINCRMTVNQMIGKQIEASMNTTAKPCDNFYQYACGNWYQQYIDQMEYGDTLGMLDYVLNRKLEDILRKVGTNTTDESIELDESVGSINDKVRIYYKSCKKVKPYNLKKYLQLIQPGFGINWYVNARAGHRMWNSEKFNWLTTIAKLRLYGLNGVFLKEEVLPRWDDSGSYSIYLDKPNLIDTLPMEQGSMIEILLDIGQTKRVANDIARSVDNFQAQMHKLHEIEDEEGPKEMQLGYLQDYMQDIDWLEYIKQLKGPTTSVDTTVIIQNIPYMRGLVKVLNIFDRPTICNYIMLKFLHFLKAKGPAEITKQECISSLRRVMPLAMSYIIGEHFYKHPERDDKIVQDIFANIKQKFSDSLNENRLGLQPPIVDALLEKVNSMKLQIGTSPRNGSSDFYGFYYSNVELDPNNFYINQLSLLRLAVERHHELLEPLAESNLTLNENVTFALASWQGVTSSPFYIKPRNVIVIPYGFLQMPVYHHNMHQIFKYSVLGFTIAHELLHGFDSSGIEYDSVGNMMGPSEDIISNHGFINGLRCMQNDMATGPNSLNEKIADYEGLRLVYNAFFNWHLKKEHSHSAILPQFSKKQLFFIHYAQFFCGKVHRGLQQKSFLEQARDERRVLKTLANFEEFAMVFNCEKRAKMVSRNRCHLW